MESTSSKLDYITQRLVGQQSKKKKLENIKKKTKKKAGN